MLDYILIGINAVVIAVMAYMGWHVSVITLEPSQVKKWRISFAVFGVINVLLTMWIYKRGTDSNNETLNGLRREVATLRTVVPLRKQAADLAAEIHDFVDVRHHRAMDGLVPGRTLSQQEERRAFEIYRVGVADYHERFDKRLTAILREIEKATGKQTEDIVKMSGAISDVGLLPAKDVANRISALAASLP